MDRLFCAVPFESCVPNTFYFWMNEQTKSLLRVESLQLTEEPLLAHVLMEGYVNDLLRRQAQRASQRISEGDFRLQKPRVPG